MPLTGPCRRAQATARLGGQAGIPIWGRKGSEFLNASRTAPIAVVVRLRWILSTNIVPTGYEEKAAPRQPCRLAPLYPAARNHAKFMINDLNIYRIRLDSNSVAIKA